MEFSTIGEDIENSPVNSITLEEALFIDSNIQNNFSDAWLTIYTYYDMQFEDEETEHLFKRLESFTTKQFLSPELLHMLKNICKECEVYPFSYEEKFGDNPKLAKLSGNRFAVSSKIPLGLDQNEGGSSQSLLMLNTENEMLLYRMSRLLYDFLKHHLLNDIILHSQILIILVFYKYNSSIITYRRIVL